MVHLYLFKSKNNPDRFAGNQFKEFNMATATLESFKADLTRLVSRFRENFKSYKNLYGNYKEAEVRLEFLDPFFKYFFIFVIEFFK